MFITKPDWKNAPYWARSLGIAAFDCDYNGEWCWLAGEGSSIFTDIEVRPNAYKLNLYVKTDLLKAKHLAFEIGTADLRLGLRKSSSKNLLDILDPCLGKHSLEHARRLYQEYCTGYRKAAKQVAFLHRLLGKHIDVRHSSFDSFF
jgi:hypothetical protein